MEKKRIRKDKTVYKYVPANSMTQARLHELFVYNSDGTFTCKKGHHSACRPEGFILTGHDDYAGYKIVWVDGRSEKLHRMIFLFHHGFLGRCTDHINGIRGDNRIENLRAATHQQNKNNTGRMNKNKPFKGVSFHKGAKKYIAHIKINKKLTHLGYFTDIEEAARAYDAQAIIHHGEFACLNFPL